MSYDIYLTHEVIDAEVGNQTYNTSPMFVKAVGCTLRTFDGKVARDIAPKLWEGIADMTESPDAYKAMNPENGWGNSEDALRYLIRFYAKCQEFPGSIVRVY